MARILSLDECPASLKAHLIKSLRTLDEAVLLPSSSRCDASGTYKNVTFRLDAREADVPIQIFSPEWGAGVSAIRVEGAWVNRLISDPTARHAALKRLKTAIPSECFDSTLQVGPALDGDESDRDKADWKAGFDGPGCFVGLFCAEHSHAPDPTKQGMNRCHSTTYLVCKAGAGQAGATFHSRLVASLRTGTSLGQALDTVGTDAPGPGPAALRRVSRAGSRNRARVLMMAGDALGAPMLDSVPDQSSCGRYRSAVTHLDVAVNNLRKIEDTHHNHVYQYSTGIDATVSQGLMSMSNLADGVVLFLSEAGEIRQNLRNEAYSTLPYASSRLIGDRELITKVVAEYKQAASRGYPAHPDSDFIRDRFTWNNRIFSPTDVDLEPLALWGSHDQEQFFAKFARELGVAKSQVVRLRPVAVCVSGLEGGKLRAALRSIPTK
tara:strand:+ start:7 stop:1317 length:1311 start_codon:yes stop_codon:yes gene_type:complete